MLISHHFIYTVVFSHRERKRERKGERERERERGRERGRERERPSISSISGVSAVADSGSS